MIARILMFVISLAIFIVTSVVGGAEGNVRIIVIGLSFFIFGMSSVVTMTSHDELKAEIDELRKILGNTEGGL